MRERRLRVPHNKLMAILNWPHAEPGSIISVTGYGVPAEARLSRVYFEDSTGSLIFVLYDESFEVVLDGEEIPWLSPLQTSILIRAPRIADRVARVAQRFPNTLIAEWATTVFNPESPQPVTILEYITSPHSAR